MKGCQVTVGSPDGWHFLGEGLLREETPEEGTRSPPCLGVGMQGGLGKERRLQGQAGLSAPPSHTAGPWGFLMGKSLPLEQYCEHEGHQVTFSGTH